MSVYPLTWVWEHSDAGGNDRLVLLALADDAGDDGGSCFPSVVRLAHRCRISRATVLRALERLEAGGEILIARPEVRGRGRSNHYTLILRRDVEEIRQALKNGRELPPFTIERGAIKVSRGAGNGLTKARPDETVPVDPSIDPLTTSPSSKAKAARERNLVWDAVVEVIGWEPVDDSDAKRVGRTVGKVRKKCPADAADAEIAMAVRGRARRYRAAWPNAELSPEALVKWWSRFGPRKAEEEPEPLTGTAAFYDPPVTEEILENRRGIAWHLHLRNEARARGEEPDYSTPVPDGWTPPERPERPVGATESDRVARGRRKVPRGFAKRPDGPEEASG